MLRILQYWMQPFLHSACGAGRQDEFAIGKIFHLSDHNHILLVCCGWGFLTLWNQDGTFYQYHLDLLPCCLCKDLLCPSWPICFLPVKIEDADWLFSWATNAFLSIPVVNALYFASPVTLVYPRKFLCLLMLIRVLEKFLSLFVFLSFWIVSYRLPKAI